MPWLGEAFAALRHLRPSFTLGLVVLGLLVTAVSAATADAPPQIGVQLSRGR